ncbi:hypothetical protein [Limoniibacter endophyticus]|uniref:Uncharacterized protein n=1 Tax=Limoniibacter endophyticus TaxID=1565040 RepID=A0A8J3DRQ3_9HYPH|nr:hypothetical protein [Limoniibacter endophyticus]GHC70394.1 hypothetical protein GCM10010136_16630 [Limoniibacter endophyticus]
MSVPKVDNPPKGSLVDLVQQREKAPTSVSFTPNAAGPQNKIAVEDVQTKVNSMVSHSTTVGVAIGNAVDQKVALDIRQQYADTVTKGNAKNFPANQAKADAMIGKQTGSLAKTAASQIKAAHDYGDLVKLEKAAKKR